MPAKSKKKSSDSLILDIAEEFRELPVWAGLLAAAVVLGACVVLLPTLLVASGETATRGTIPLGPIFAPFVRIFGILLAAAILLFSLFGAGERGIDRLVSRLRGRPAGTSRSPLDGTAGPLTWADFERNLAASYEPLGWTVLRRGGSRPDGGVDIELARPGEKVLVQCKHWSRRQVGVKEVRELWGVVAHEGATRAVLATTGYFTDAASDFAIGKPLDLMDRPKVESFIQGSAAFLPAVRAPRTEDFGPATPCPACGRPMILRTARRGTRVGEQFWGCSGFPDCRQVIRVGA